MILTHETQPTEIRNTRYQRGTKSYHYVLRLVGSTLTVSQACREAGISRSRFYEIKKSANPDALVSRTRIRPRMPNQTSDNLEQLILEATHRFPTYSYLRISAKLRAAGHAVAPASVRGVWGRHDLNTTPDRLRWLQARTGQLPQRYVRILCVAAPETSTQGTTL